MVTDKSQAEVNFGRVCGPSTPVGLNATLPQPFFQTILPTSERLYPFHSHQIHATQILRGLCNAPYHGQRV